MKKQTVKSKSPRLAEIRRAVADYMWSEGCSCCRNISAHRVHEAALGKLLRVPKYPDGSGYDFSKFRTVPAEGDR